MSDVKWIKLYVNARNGKSMRQIKALPDGHKIALFWYEIMQLAGECNENGFLYYFEDFPYTDEMLANEFGYDVSFVEYALNIFYKMKMVEIIDNVYFLTNWEKYQNVASLEKIREQTRKRVAKHRAKLLGNVTCNVTVTDSNATDIDKDIDKDIDSNNNIDFEKIKDYWNKHSKLKEIVAITEKRKSHLNARIKEHGIEAVYKVIDNTGKSAFMRGENNRCWIATFDWVIKPNNFIKVLEGAYAIRKNKEKTPHDFYDIGGKNGSSKKYGDGSMYPDER